MPIVVVAGTGCVLDASRRVGLAVVVVVVVVVSSRSAQQLQHRVLTDMGRGEGVGGRGWCAPL